MSQEIKSSRAVKAVVTSDERHWVGDGFLTRTVFSYQSLGTDISPFLLLDYGGPVEFDKTTKRRGVGEHPHRGFETVTIVYSGQLEHRDSGGGGGTIGPGDVQWMTAGAGVIHEERHTQEFASSGGTMEMAQLWVNLPARDKMTRPRYQSLTASNIPKLELPADSGTARVISGELYGVRGPAKTFTPVNLWDLQLMPGSTVNLPVTDGHTVAVVVIRGEIRLTASGETAGESALVLFQREGTSIGIEALSGARLLLMSGEPINEPIAGYGPFVMNSAAEIQQAFEDFQAGRFAPVAATEQLSP